MEFPVVLLHLYADLCICVHVRVYADMCVCVRTCVHVYVCTYVRMCVYVCVVCLWHCSCYESHGFAVY